MDSLSPHADNSNPSFITILLNKGFSVIVDLEDADLAQFRWMVNEDSKEGFYALRWYKQNGKSTTVGMHRIILERKLGRPIQPRMQVDHINGDRGDNRRQNLREATPAQNAANRRHKHGSTTSQYKGVILNKGRWEASILHGRTSYYLGFFDTEELAAQAYDRAAVELYGEFAGTNHETREPSTQSALLKVGQLSRANKSGFRGVSWRKKGWCASLGSHSKNIYLGVFEDKIEAARAYDRAAIALRGKKASTNFPHEDYE